jgi:hypothetical protein
MRIKRGANEDYAATERDTNKSRRADEDYVTTERDTKTARRVKFLADVHNGDPSTRDLFKQSAIANGNCMNQECFDFV